MRVQFDEGDATVLRKRIASESKTFVRDRHRVALLAGEGVGGKFQTREQIAAAVGRSRQFVDEWVGRYRKLGLAGLEARKAKGNRPSLTPAEQERSSGACRPVRPRLMAEGTLRGSDAKRILEQEFGKPLNLGTVYLLMHKMDLSCLRPRPRHRKNDPAAMQQWLDRAPFLSEV